MKILVGVKRVVDANTPIRLKLDGSGVDTSDTKMSMNPFDAIAVEEAVRLSEAGQADEVVLVSIGPAESQEVLRAGLAMGAHRAIHVRAEGRVEPLSVAKVLAAIAKREGPSLILLGKQAIDDDCNQTGQMLSAILGWGQGTFASRVNLGPDSVAATLEVDGGLMTVELRLPAVITTDLRLNTPRYASLPNIMKAKRKPIEELSPGDLSVAIESRLSVLKVEAPSMNKHCLRLDTVEELVTRLRADAAIA